MDAFKASRTLEVMLVKTKSSGAADGLGRAILGDLVCAMPLRPKVPTRTVCEFQTHGSPRRLTSQAWVYPTTERTPSLQRIGASASAA